MSRRRTAKPAGIQLFPFLAVLICTMGALVVLLHAFARHGQQQGEKIAAAKARANVEQEQKDVEDLEWRIGHLREARAKTAAQLNDERLKLSHIEDHERRLREQLRTLQLSVKEMDQTTQAGTAQQQRGAAELAEVEAQLAAARRAVDEAQRKGRHTSVSYSVVPYHGRNGTDRRPIYIECRENLIILQPEGVELTPRDFAGAFGPGNPLAAAVRAKREYYAGQAPRGSQPEEPYPLMLVRPDGIAAYYAARAALDSWGSDFGYELIGSDWRLKFPAPDPRLVELTREVVAEARLRHRELAEAVPQSAKRRTRPEYRALSHGGFAPAGGGSPGGGTGPGGFSDFAGDWATGGAPRATEDPYSDEPGKPGPTTPGGSAHGGSSTPGGHAAWDARSGDGAVGDGDSIAREAEPARSTGRSGPGGRSADWGLGAEPPPDGAGFADSGAAAAGGGVSAHTESATSPDASAQAATGNASGRHAPSGSASGQPSTSSDSSSIHIGSAHHPQAPTGKKPKSIAATRGSGWGLPESTVGAVGATRPILIDCYPDRLLVMSDDPRVPAREIRFGARTEEAMDELVSTVWDQINGWGKAGKGLYWKPTLSMNVRPGAATRFAEIRDLLADSGLDVHERQPAAPRPQTTRRPTQVR